MSNIINTKTGAWGLSEGDVKSWAIEQGLTVLWSLPFEPIEPFAFYAESAPPAHDPATHKAVQIKPGKVVGVLTQKWAVVTLDADELAIREAERLAQEQAEREANRIIITRTQGLITLYRLKGVQEAGIQALIDQIPDEAERYEAGLYFRAANWHSDDKFVQQIAPHVGAETDADLRALFECARTV